MSKLTPEAVEKAAKSVGIDDEKRHELIAMLADMLAPEDDEPKPPPVKKQWCILVSDPVGKLAGVDLAGWVLQIPEDESVQTTEERVFRAAYDFNATKRGRLMPVQTVGEAVEHVAAKHFKEAQVWVKTREPVLVLRTNNEIPKTPDVLGGDRGNYRKEVA